MLKTVAVLNATIGMVAELAKKPTHSAEAALIVIINKEGKVAALERGDGKGLGIICGGVDPGEMPAASAIREAEEESGLVLEASKLVPVYSLPAPSGRCLVHCFAYMYEGDIPSLICASKREGVARWVEPSEFLKESGSFQGFNTFVLHSLCLL